MQHGRVRVNAIDPGTTLTDSVIRNVTGDAMEHRLARIPLGRLGEPSDIAAAVAFLASDDSAWITVHAGCGWRYLCRPSLKHNKTGSKECG
jgi:NAD(P)-dependent dehydrogenase (short-subunit alcohol dehydrogenase family)